ncbi:MAG: hypothetical protein NTW86_05200, partial [Candidatus Sumerlaeota bacterium]|nr:hypothetical protein [Candidatus Sumerlaeota bacterium]
MKKPINTHRLLAACALALWAALPGLARAGGAMAITPGPGVAPAPTPKEKVVLRARHSLDRPARVFLMACNTTPTTRTATLTFQHPGLNEDLRWLAESVLLPANEARGFAFPARPLLAMAGPTGNGVFCANSVIPVSDDKGWREATGSPADTDESFWSTGFDIFLLQNPWARAIYSPMVNRSFFVDFDSAVEDSLYAGIVVGGSDKRQPSFTYELDYTTVAPGGLTPRHNAFVISPDDSRFPNDPAQLTWLDAIFLDGPSVGAWSAEQKQALELWVARGGLLFLDPPALNALGGSALARGVHADLGTSRTIDLGPLRPKALVASPPAAAGGPSPQGPSQFSVGGQAFQLASSQPTAPEPLLVDGVDIVDGVDEMDLPGFFSLGPESALASWSFGGGRVAVQAFEGVGDPKTIERWLRIQRNLRPANAMPSAMVASQPFEGDFASTWSPRRGDSELDQFLGALRARFASSRAARGVMIGMGVYVVAAFALFLVMRFAGRGRWRRLLVAQAIVLLLAAGGVYWCGTRNSIRAQVWEALLAFPDTPWAMRQIRLT